MVSIWQIDEAALLALVREVESERYTETRRERRNRLKRERFDRRRKAREASAYED